MAKPSVLEKEIKINAPASKVWGMFSDAALTRQMGGEYESDWQVGSSFGWKNLSGQQLTDGRILKIEPGRVLQHSLFYPGTPGSIMATILYQLREEDGQTIVAIREDFTNQLSEEELNASALGWDAALDIVKTLLEK